jgi:hypothetical protein
MPNFDEESLLLRLAGLRRERKIILWKPLMSNPVFIQAFISSLLDKRE